MANIEKLILLDLDGTLTDTASGHFKKYKDGLEDFEVSTIPIISGAHAFIEELKKDMGIKIAIVSDSHPSYVNKISAFYFDVPCLALADKPNISKTKSFIENNFGDIAILQRRMIMIGDSWLDIELARGLEIPSIYTRLYENSSPDPRDGIGDHIRSIKSGPTYEASSFQEILKILKTPKNHLLCLEAGFLGIFNHIAREIKTVKIANDYTLIRTLARQQSGCCDRFALTQKYNEFQMVHRSKDLMVTVKSSVQYYLNNIIKADKIVWDILTYIPEKSDTQNNRKMVEVIEELEIGIEKKKILGWNISVQGTVKGLKKLQERKDFMEKNLHVSDPCVFGKNIIVLDDQYTTGATAETTIKKLKEAGAKSINFITFFYLIHLVSSGTICPICGKNLVIKIRKVDGVKFLSCLPPKYGGSGCGYGQNL
jgi:phosphoglycolate phosphatase-like HAD superfamily hydrolase